MKRFSKKEIFSIPNLMGYFRILLIPVFCYLYITAETEREYLYAVLVVLLSSLTDLFDGKIARRFHMVTELGKALDPIADKLTHAALAICLATRYPMMWALIALMLVKEGYMGIMEASSNYNKVVTVQGFGTDATNGWLLQDASGIHFKKSGKALGTITLTILS